ncbi:MAG TPA: hypothetical protein VJT67_08660 [Longimicrobiaceae bacterium]|nr:hypothetical protein [Longimicrobiaceae bacterium]
MNTAQRRRRRRSWLGALAVLAAVWLVVGTIRALDKPPRIATLPGARVYYYLTPETHFARDQLKRSLEVTDEGILFHLGSALVELRRPAKRWDAVVEPFLVTGELEELDQFTVDAGGVILVVRGASLLQVTGAGALAPVAPLPDSAMRVAPSREPGFVYLLSNRDFDRDDHGPDAGTTLTGSVFLLSDHDGGVRRVARLASAPVALSEGADGYYLATDEGDLIQVLGARKRRVFSLPPAYPGSGGEFGLTPIESIAATDDPRLIFFSTRTTVYALLGGSAVPVTRNLGGTVRWRDGVLFVLDPDAGFLVGIGHLADALGLASP